MMDKSSRRHFEIFVLENGLKYYADCVFFSFFQIVSSGGFNLHEMLNLFFWENKIKIF